MSDSDDQGMIRAMAALSPTAPEPLPGGSRNKAMGGGGYIGGAAYFGARSCPPPPPPSGAAEGIYDWGASKSEDN